MKRSTINKREIDKFSKMADEWWNPEGKFKPLHKFNPIRIHYIKENLIRIGLNLCKGLNLPWGSHHSSAIFENFSISFLFTLLM